MQKNGNQEKQFEVIVSPTDVLEKELDEVLGGAGDCTYKDCCYSGGCKGQAGCFDKKKPQVCPPGYVWDGEMCVQIEE